MPEATWNRILWAIVILWLIAVAVWLIACSYGAPMRGVEVTETRRVEVLDTKHVPNNTCVRIGKLRSGRVVHYCPDDQDDSDDLIVIERIELEEGD